MHQRSKFDKLHRETAGAWLRLPDSSGGSVLRDMFYGTVGSYDAVNQVITTTGTPTALPTGTPTIPAGVKCYDRENAGFSAADNFYAIRQVAVHTDGTHGQVDWVVLPTAAGQSNTVNVQLYNNVKHRTDTVVEVKLLDASLAAIGDPLNCYDPHQEFSGGLADDAIGRATVVRDADTGDTRLEFTHLRGPAAWVCATLYEDMGTGPTDALATVDSFHGLDWSNEDPSDTNGRVTVVPCGDMHANLKTGDEVVAVLKDPDTDPITYLIVESGGNREVLIAKLTATVPKRVGVTLGSLGAMALGHPVAGDWTEVLASATVWNPAQVDLFVSSGSVPVYAPVWFINGHWCLNPTELPQVTGWTFEAEMHLVQCSGELPEWRDKAPIVELQLDDSSTNGCKDLDFKTACSEDWENVGQVMACLTCTEFTFVTEVNCTEEDGMTYETTTISVPICPPEV